MTPALSLLDREAVLKAIDDRMTALQDEWDAIDDAQFCNTIEYARGHLAEVFNDIVAGEYDIELPISLANLPPVLLVKDLVRRADEGDPSIMVYPLPDGEEHAGGIEVSAVRLKGEFVGPGVIIAAFGEVA